MNIVVLPLDERPVNTRYPRMIVEIAGATVTIPPLALLSARRQAADSTALAAWLQEQVATCDVLIVSIEMLGYGGLIASRTTQDTTLDIMQRLAVLRDIKAPHPNLRIYAFNVITRISNANDAVEEPLYWQQYGTRLYRYSQLMHRRQAGQDVQAELDALLAELPAEAVADFTRRRLRNHLINLHLLEMLGDDVFDLLVLSSDDTSEYGFGSQEKAWLQTWVSRLYGDDPRLLMYPGADEIGCVLLMRALNEGNPRPKFYVDYAIADDKAIIAPYEDSPIHVTVERQIRAIGGVQVLHENEADIVLAVNTPSRIREEYNPLASGFAEEQERRQPALVAFVQRMKLRLATHQRLAIADVAYPNGSDPQLMALLLEHLEIRQLAAYGAWNTAGNTIGTTIAQALATLLGTSANIEAQQRFLLHRFVEDWGYQHLVRQQVRDELKAQIGVRETNPTHLSHTIASIHQHLNALLPALCMLGEGWQVENVRLPWQRTFEVDFDLVKL
jgi:hypothetical protein